MRKMLLSLLLAGVVLPLGAGRTPREQEMEVLREHEPAADIHEHANGPAPGLDPADARVKLSEQFQEAAIQYDVPVEVLLTISYAENRWNDHGGRPSIDNGYGLMHLVENPQAQTLTLAAELTGAPPERLRRNRAANIRGGAAILRAWADEAGMTASERGDVNAWYPVVARYSNARDRSVAADYADQVFGFLAGGLSSEAVTGEVIEVLAREVEPNRRGFEGLVRSPAPDFDGVPPAIRAEGAGAPSGAGTLSTDYGPAYWVAASTSNYRVANRPSDYAIDRVVIHDTEGSYSGTINWFKNPSARVSAHYVLRSSDGQITQMVREKDVAWHVACWNNRSIGLEHEGYASQPGWYTDPMYRASAALVRNICNKYGIPKDRTHIVSHKDVSDQTGCTDHTDPGNYWDWTYFMNLVNGSTYSTIVDNATSGRFTASGNWGLSSYSSGRYGADYRYANPQAVSDAAWFKVNIPSTGSYEVFAWWPANSGYSSSVPFVVMTTTGAQYIYRDQRVNGGKWNSLGVFSLAAGDTNIVGVSRWTSASGYVIADAVKVVRK